MSVTVREALDIGGLRKGEVIAGRDGLGNEIRHVSVIEVPDAFRWFRGCELWLTAFFNLKDNIEAQVQMIEQIWKRKSAGLVICYPDTYMRGISPDLVRKADNLRVPVILVPEDVAYIDVISPLLEEILARETKKIKYAFSVHERLTNIVFDRGKAGNMTRVAKELALILDKAVILTDHRNKVVTNHSLRQKGVETLWDAPAVASLLARHQDNLQDGETLHVESTPRLMLRPIVFGHRFYGTVIVVDADGIGRLEEIAIDQARIAFAAGLMNRIAMEESENQKKNDFLNDLLRGRFKTDESILMTTQQLSWDISGKRIALYAKMDASKSHPRLGDALKAKISDAIHQDNPSNICVFKNTSVSAFLEGREGYRRLKDRGRVLGEALIGLATAQDGTDLVVGIGSYAPGPLDLKASYEKARRAALIAKELMGYGKTVSIDDVALYYYLYEMAAGEEVRNYLVSQVRNLREYDESKGTDLFRTFEMLMNDEPVADTASTLCVHRNTISYRKHKIRQILGIDPFKEPFKTNYRMVLSLFSLLNRY